MSTECNLRLNLRALGINERGQFVIQIVQADNGYSESHSESSSALSGSSSHAANVALA